ncbi:hypothetical protein [Chitinophaga tropicalis]|uniref:Uncharacterized protein n=1 Tax=Chitinophaga tropicalis TaxID=2683588 RepID=A0A7K1U060_9BACT|nr:hypothetical protein [Chitinophaga tropicalis]MVT07757.1 hypothetical protein [Chitinophaga tropicalis]
MTNTYTSKNGHSTFLKQGGNWQTGKVDKNNPDVKKGIETARQMQKQIMQQKESNPESLKRVVKL